jgi:hypothetical protein
MHCYSPVHPVTIQRGKLCISAAATELKYIRVRSVIDEIRDRARLNDDDNRAADFAYTEPAMA